MDSLRELFQQFSDLPALIRWAGYVGVTLIVFTETGLLIGFFLPGDSLLVTAGLLSSQGLLNVYLLGFLLNIAAISGNSGGYWIGRTAGPRLFRREDSLLFRKKHLYSASAFYARHGGKTMIIAQYVPIIRTFAPVAAGAAIMPYRRFLAFSILGTTLWVWSMLMTGYILGRYIPGISEHIEWVILIVISLSLLPAVISWWRDRRRRIAEPSLRTTDETAV
jgi:membrane-associated protein